MKKKLTFTVILIGIVSTAFSQVTDSITISYEQGNEIANGLVNEQKLKKAYKSLLLEHSALEQSYRYSNELNITYKDTVIPAYKEIIKSEQSKLTSQKEYSNTLNTALKSQKKKKWLWLGSGAALGIIFGFLIN